MSDIQEQIKLAHKRAEENDIKLLKEEIKEILNRLEIVARKHTIEVCENGSKIETLPASVVDELRLNNYSAKILLDYITNLQEENEYFNHCDEEKRKTITNLRYKIERLEEDNKQLKELCDKYEEEHKTTFEEWKKDIKTNKKAIRQIEIILEIALEQDSENVNLIDRLRYILNILNGVDEE